MCLFILWGSKRKSQTFFQNQKCLFLIGSIHHRGHWSGLITYCNVFVYFMIDLYFINAFMYINVRTWMWCNLPYHNIFYKHIYTSYYMFKKWSWIRGYLGRRLHRTWSFPSGPVLSQLLWCCPRSQAHQQSRLLQPLYSSVKSKLLSILIHFFSCTNMWNTHLSLIS